MIPLPPNWDERTEWNSRSTDAVGRLGLCRRSKRLIEYYPRWWLAPIWPLVRPLVMAHERGHAHGIPKTGCLGGHRWCMMAEEQAGQDSWLGKARLWPAQLVAGLQFCEACRGRIGW